MLTPVVLDVLAGFSEFGSGEDGGGDADGGAAAATCLSFEAHVGWLYPLACDLVCCRSIDSCLKQLFEAAAPWQVGGCRHFLRLRSHRTCVGRLGGGDRSMR